MGTSRAETMKIKVSRRSAAAFTHPIHLPLNARILETKTLISVPPPEETTENLMPFLSRQVIWCSSNFT